MPRGQMKPVKKVKKGTFSRVIKYMAKDYTLQLLFVIVGIFVSVFCTLQGTLFQKTLIDSYILPMIQEGSTDFTPSSAKSASLLPSFAKTFGVKETQNITPKTIHILTNTFLFISKTSL